MKTSRRERRARQRAGKDAKADLKPIIDGFFIMLLDEDSPWSYEDAFKAFNERWQKTCAWWNRLGRYPVDERYFYEECRPIEQPYSLGLAGRSLQWLRDRLSYSDLSSK